MKELFYHETKVYLFLFTDKVYFVSGQKNDSGMPVIKRNVFCRQDIYSKPELKKTF